MRATRRTTFAVSLVACLIPCPTVSADPSDSALSGLARVLHRGRWTAAQVHFARRMLRAGESIRTRSPRGVTVLMMAAKAGDVSLMRAALKAGVDVNARTDEGCTALSMAMVSRSPEKVRLLLDAGAHPDAADHHGRTPLMLAAQFKFRGGSRS